MNNKINLDRCVLEIGSNLGNDTNKLYETYKLPILAIEPTPELINVLWSKYRKEQNILILPIAIDSEPGFKKFNIAGHHDWGCSSFYDFNKDIHNLWQDRPDFKFTDSVNVACFTAKTIVQSFSIKEIEYLWIDTQGNDLRVLQSFEEKLDIVKKGKCEASYTVELYEKADNHYSKIENFLQSRGFKTNIVPDVVGKECDVHFERNI